MLRRLGVTLRADGDQVRCAAPRGVLTPSVRAEIGRRKSQILVHLRQRPLSFGEESLWFLEQLQGDRADYNLSISARLRGALDPARLARSLEAVARRHETLRTTFVAAGGHPFRIIAADPDVSLPLTDLRDLPADDREAELQRLAAAETRRPFDLARGPCWRTRLVRLNERDHVLLVAKHQIVSDGWSTQVFFRELAACYEAFAAGAEPALGDLPMQYADFAEWQRASLDGGRLDPLLAYWRRALADAPPALDLPTDYARVAVQPSDNAQHSLTLSAALSRGLRALGRLEGVTPFMTLLAAFGVLLHRYTGQDDVLVGAPIAGRSRPETESLIGFFVNTLVLRIGLAGDPTFHDLLHRVRETAVGAYAHQDLPFELLVEHLRPPRDLSRTPLFQAFFNMHPFDSGRLELADLTLDITRLHEPAAKFDLSLHVRDEPAALRIVLAYNAALFESATAVAMLDRFRVLLEAIVADPARALSRLPWGSGAPAAPAAPAGAAGPAAAAPSLASRFEAEVRRRPDAVAIDTGRDVWTYAALNGRANRVARALLARRGRGEDRVALLFEHDAPMIAAILGVLKAGKTYVALDPLDPDERLRRILADAEVGALVTHAEHVVTARALAGPSLLVLDVDDLGEAVTDGDVGLALGPDSLAYILYTSGSTGRPKGVMQTHGNVGYFIATYAERLGLDGGDRLTLLARYGSDASVMDIFGALLNGAALAPFDLRRHEVATLSGWLARQAISIYHSTPTVYRHLVRALNGTAEFPALRRIVLGGEAVYREDVERARRHFPPTCVLVNALGPTESTLALMYPVDRWTEIKRHAVPVGHPVPGTDVLLLGGAGAPMDGHGIGEIAIRSPGLSPGYWRQPELTAAAFRADPTGGSARVYCTGDLGRRLPDGTLEYVGRKDWQVKVRGHRVEPGEIEAALRDHPAIRDAAVVTRRDGGEDARLVAHVVPALDAALEAGVLRRWLQRRLPAYMLPAAFVVHADLPLTSTGKIDRRRLGDVPAPADHDDEPRVTARTPLEEMIAGIWAAVLGVAEIGSRDDFFELGGHSLLAVQVMARVRDAVGVEVPLRALFEAPTVGDLARALEEARAGRGWAPALPIVRSAAPGPAPLTVAQEQLWGIDQALPGLPSFNIPLVLHLHGALDVEALGRSLDEIVRRHESLRTRFEIVEGRPAQVVVPDLRVTLTLEDLEALPESDRGLAAGRAAAAEARQPFDLSRTPLLRARLLPLHVQEHLLLLTFHHIVADAWSLRVFMQELAALYEAFAAGHPSPLAELPIQCADFARWQRQWLSTDARDAALAHWKAQLAGPLPPLGLPTDRPRAPGLHLETARHAVALPASLSEALGRQGRRDGATLFMSLLAGFDILLHLTTGQDDVRVGTLVAGRHRRELERLIGFFVDLVLLRTDLGGDPTLREVRRRVRATALAASAHPDLPFEEVARSVERERGLARSALCQVMLVLNPPLPRFGAPGLRMHGLEVDPRTGHMPMTLTACDLVLLLREGPEGLAGNLVYNTALFDASTVAAMCERFREVLEDLVATPERRLSDYRRRDCR